MNKVKGLVIFILALLILPLSVFAQGFDELTQLYGEEVIVTASKRAQKISDSPSAITVVTAEDIKQSGAVTLPEALMMVPGMQLGYTSSGFMMAGGIRGFNKLPANKFILLVDGVPQSFEIYNIPSFNPIDIPLNQIDRIEVVRGPGSSLYGANAMFGVINIITKKPEDTQGSQFSVTGGTLDTAKAAYSYSGNVDNRLNYRVSLKSAQQDQFDDIQNSEDPAYKYKGIRTVFDYDVNDNSDLNLTLAYIDVQRMYAVIDSTGPINYKDEDYFNGKIEYTVDDPEILVRAFASRKDLWDSGWYGSGAAAGQLPFLMGEYGVDFQHSFQPIENDNLVWGLSFLKLWAKGPSIAGRHEHDMSGIFFDNTYSFTDTLDLNAGIRFDHHPNGGDHMSHRLSLLYDLAENHNLRFTWGTSFRNPDFVETYYDSTYIHGNEDLDPSKAETFEIGYQGVFDKLKLGTNVFYTEVADLVYIEETNPVTLQYNFINYENIKQYGIEAEVSYPLADWLDGALNYTCLQQWEEEQANSRFNEQTPQHMANAQLRANFDNGLSANLSVHYRGSVVYNEMSNFTSHPVLGWNAGGKCEDYVTANARVGYEFEIGDNPAEFSVAALNLFDTPYSDYPINNYDVRRRVTATLTYKF
jgi:iron complex outermembrane receptor protein